MDDEKKLLIKHLKQRNMNGYYVDDKSAGVKKALELIPSGSTVGFGGSVTLEQCGILDILRERGDIELYDRTKLSDHSDIRNLYLKMYSCDVFLTSTNALTTKGQLVNVDGRGNRVSMITYGPRKVIVIAGKNKITPDTDAAFERISTIACPKNLQRVKNLSKSSSNSSNQEWTLESIWGQISIIERQLKNDNDRIHVILVNEE